MFDAAYCSISKQEDVFMSPCRWIDVLTPRSEAEDMMMLRFQFRVYGPSRIDGSFVFVHCLPGPHSVVR